MTALALPRPRRRSTRASHANRNWWTSYFAVLGLTLVLAAATYLFAPEVLSLGALVAALLLAVTIFRPQIGLYFIVFFGLSGDGGATNWYPFVKNFSSPESLFYVGAPVPINPLEVFLAAVTFGWICRMATMRTWALQRGSLFRPLMVFTMFVVTGFVYGVARGGDRNIALWEIRPLLTMTIMYVLTVNLATTRAHYRRLWGVFLAAVTVNAIVTLVYYAGLSAAKKETLDHLGDHQAGLQTNAFLILIMAMALMGRESTRRVWLLVALVPLVGSVYLLAERRSAFVGLLVGCGMFAAFFHRIRPRAFWCVMPVLLLAFFGYVGAFWNSQGSLGFPAQAVKTVIAPNDLSVADQQSNFYRRIENFNLVYTVRSAPLTGLGFGHKYLRPIPNADISFFVWWEYRPHNSILWLWIQMGIGGFIATMYLLASAVRDGTRRVLTMPRTFDAAIVLTSVVFVVMYAVFSYVDIAWDTESMLFLGLSLACIGTPVLASPPLPRESISTNESAGRAAPAVRAVP